MQTNVSGSIFGKVCDLAVVRLNGQSARHALDRALALEITKAVRPGDNVLEVDIINPWNNRLVGDLALPPEQRRTYLALPVLAANSPLLPAGLLGPSDRNGPRSRSGIVTFANRRDAIWPEEEGSIVEDSHEASRVAQDALPLSPAGTLLRCSRQRARPPADLEPTDRIAAGVMGTSGAHGLPTSVSETPRDVQVVALAECDVRQMERQLDVPVA